MRRRVSFALFLWLAIASLPSGCSSAGYYKEPDLPSDEVAQLDREFMESYYVLGGSFIDIVGIDGSPPDPFHAGLNHRLTPGRHVITVGRRAGIGCATTTQDTVLVMVAEPGHAYRLSSDTVNNTHFIWIADKATNEVIAGVAPKPAQP